MNAMIDLESLWSDARADTPVCSKTGTTKTMVLGAITKGARDVDAVARMVPLCDGECALKNVSCRSCRENVEAILHFYAPINDMMKEGHCHLKVKPIDLLKADINKKK